MKNRITTAAALAACLSAGVGHAGDYEMNRGKTPPMGWNSWAFFKKGISSEKIRGILDGAARNKLNEAGYTYIVIDDGWQEGKLAPDGSLMASASQFPEGIPALARYAADRGFKLGIYSSPNVLTCGGRPGSLGHEELHAKQFVDWGCKFVKYDTCPTRNKEQGLSPSEFVKRIRTFGTALHAADPDMVYALCDKGWGGGVNKRQRKPGQGKITQKEKIKAYSWCPEVGGVMWRTTGDSGPRWKRLMQILDEQEGMEAISGPNAYNDPDILEVGNGDLTENENRSHFSLWCVLNAPLILGNDLRNIPKSVLDIITNKEVIALNQDLMCKQAKKVVDEGDIEYFVKPLADGDSSVCVLNRSDAPVKVSPTWTQLGLRGNTYAVRDVWAHQDLGTMENGFSREVDTHAVFVVRVKPLR